MPDAVDLQLDRLGDIVADQFEAWMSHPLGNIGFPAREVVIEADHFLARFHLAIAEMGAKETSATGDEITGERTGHQMRFD